jgi:hypothetical protein
MNIRLDFISTIEQQGLDHMADIRKVYMQLDDLLVHHSKMPMKPLDGAGNRALALARTNLETSLQYAIKTLCLQYEIK